jgi:hypothetical protein
VEADLAKRAFNGWTETGALVENELTPSLLWFTSNWNTEYTSGMFNLADSCTEEISQHITAKFPVHFWKILFVLK